MSKQLGFFIDSNICIGCKGCQIACKDKNNLEVGRLWRRVYEVNGGGWQMRDGFWEANLFAYTMSVGCMHCQNPVCVEVCPAGAYSKRADGVTVLDRDKCIGCRYCEWACPYGAPQFQETSGTMSKCDFCVDLVDKGEQPACVAACPMRAIEFGDLSELQAKHGMVAEVYPLPDPAITSPALVVKPHRDARLANAATARIANSQEV